jgi:chromosome partitioning protein
MIICVGGEKGGSGKTTISTNLAIMCGKAGQDVLLIDADGQESASDFSDIRSEECGELGYVLSRLTDNSVKVNGQPLSEKFDTTIIDVPGKDSRSQRAALLFCDVLLLPIKPDGLNIWTLSKLKQIILDAQMASHEFKVIAFLNMAESSGNENQEAWDFISEEFENVPGFQLEKIEIKNRKSFRKAASVGLSVSELKPRDNKACSEIDSLYSCIF